MNIQQKIVIGLSLVLFASCSRPIADFAFQKEGDQAPAKVLFENKSNKAVEYLWDFGDGNKSDEKSPVHRFVQSGNYEIALTVKNDKGKSNQIKKRIMVKAPEKCMVEIQTSFGNMLVELYDETPQHRDNFSKLAEEGYYDGLLFHRVISGFMVQGGDPNSRNASKGTRLGSGGPGYQVPAEFNEDFCHVKGALAAARTGDNVNPERKSSGSQFYIVQGKEVTEEELNYMSSRNGINYSPDVKAAYSELGGTPFLDGQYTVFGRVVDGLDVIDKIAAVSKDSGDRPLENVEMKVVLIK
jgi:peptidyl-prolyl cis-trans isomerase B (cyclophilin B)